MTTNKTEAQNMPTLRSQLQWIRSITRPVHRPLLISTICRALATISDILLFGTIAYALFIALNRYSAWGLVGIIVLLAILKAILRYYEQFTGHYVAFKALELLRTHAFSKLWPKAPGIVAQSKTGELLTTLTKDIDRIEVLYAHTFAPFVCAYILTPLGIITGGFLIGWKAMIVPAISALLALVVIPWIGARSSQKATTRELEQRRKLNQHLTDTLYGIPDVLTYGAQEKRLKETDELSDSVMAVAKPARIYTALRRALNLFAMLGATAWIIWVGTEQYYTLFSQALQTHDGRYAIHFGALTIACAVGMLRLWSGPSDVETVASALHVSIVAVTRLHHICTHDDNLKDGEKTLPTEKTGLSIDIDNITYAYPHGSQVLNGISLTIPEGSYTVITGHSGCGKSTLLHLIQRYADPDTGKISIDGIPLTDIQRNSLYRRVCAVAQKNDLINASIAYNLRLGAPDATDEELEHALHIVSMDQDVQNMPEGLDTKVGGKPQHGQPAGYALSGGQVARLCLARALLMRPAILILDEWAAALDIDTEEEIRERLREEMPGLTIIEVTHRHNIADEAEAVITLDKGRIFQGANNQLATQTEENNAETEGNDDAVTESGDAQAENDTTVAENDDVVGENGDAQGESGSTVSENGDALAEDSATTGENQSA
ncbi:ABC transporter ATP-binding protein [Actinotignum urinale]|uniref:amino acid ABC transporter ATP-binding/permease protein n=1 Tax=Actinotignum urinale TaxID=190146 RepID=UPI002A83245B|nr:ABC transporter ATP-binding protein [Actinotignum urinale]MDY5129711.1 ABC transporter ATP-binding protein [Actinotignum urinale]